MSSTGSTTAPTSTAKAPSFKRQYKLQGMIAGVAIMWVDYALIYRGLVAGDTTLITAGMIVMLGGAAVAYYFG
ncbi:MAG: hypothetical protein AB7O28_00610 [Vicinamibacterales bacterium]